MNKEITEELVGAKLAANPEDYLSIEEILRMESTLDFIKESDVIWIAAVRTSNPHIAWGWKLFELPITKLPPFETHFYRTRKKGWRDELGMTGLNKNYIDLFGYEKWAGLR